MSVPLGQPPELSEEEWDRIWAEATAAASGQGPVIGGTPTGAMGASTPLQPGSTTGGYGYPGIQPQPNQAASGQYIGGNGYPYPVTPGTGAPMLPGGGRGPLVTGAQQLLQDLQAVPGTRNIPFLPGNTPQVENPFASSGLPINETLLASLIYDNPQLAITMGGTAERGTPGYWNLAGLDFDPYNIYLAQGGNVLNGPTEYLQFASNMYNTLGTVGSQGGGTVNAGALLRNMVMTPPDSQLGIMFAEAPETFYQMAVDVSAAAGMSPLGQQALKLQLAQMYQEYMEYSLTANAGDTLPFNTWMVNAHPEIVMHWGTGG
jgi:hypothetical protein